MREQDVRFRMLDGLYLCLTVVPLIIGMLLTLLTRSASHEIEITGARIYFTIPMPLQELPITEAIINSWLVILALVGLCLWLTHGISASEHITKRQACAEWIVSTTENLVKTNMGAHFDEFPAFIGAIMVLSAFSSLLALLGMYPPTSDLNIVGGWAILVFALITRYKMKAGLRHYLRSFGDPVPLLSPLNIISEIATPVSMAFRHYGNILSGSVISVLVGTALRGLSTMLLGRFSEALGRIPILQVGIPAILSIYFDVFSSLLQAFIFAMLTMLYIASGFPEEAWAKMQSERTAAQKG